jgi:hypothetical protein
MQCKRLNVHVIFELIIFCNLQVPGQQMLSDIQRRISSQYPNSMLIHGVLRRPPSGYHYETIRDILNNYPKNSYQIRHGIANIVSQNNHGSSSSNKNKGFKKPKKKSKKNKSKNNNDGGNDGGDPGDGGGLPDDSPLPDTSPPTDGSPADSPEASPTPNAKR